MNFRNLKHLVVSAATTLLLVYPICLYAQGLSNLTPNGAGQASSTLTGNQQSLANKALCSALASQTPNPAAASPSALNNPTVMTAAASSFAGATQLPLPSATSLLQGYVAQHATGILASCAVSNATGGLTGQIPAGSTMPSMPKY
ncbi:MAG TPA: hypothetical protein VHY56_08070 [Candidatus Binataceae bacterium]|nr:hypothetical protein [Candidatus Binataceae bacterium]